MTEAEAIGATTALAEMATTFFSLWLTLTFGYLTVAYFQGVALSRFQCVAVSLLYGIAGVIFAAAGAGYTKATEVMLSRGGTLWEQLPALLLNIPWAESITAFFVFSTVLAFYFMYNIRQAETA